MPVATYTVELDLNNDGAYGGGDETISGRVRASPGISIKRGRDQVRSFTPPVVAACDLEVDNQDRAFSPENAASPLYGSLLPGRRLRVRATFNDTTYGLGVYYLTDVAPQPDRRRRSASLPCLGGLGALVGKKVSTLLYQDIRTDEALAKVLDAVGWPAAERVLDVGKTKFLWWWLDDTDAWQAAQQIVASEGPGAELYEDENGKIVFESRHYKLLQGRCLASQATFRDGGAEPLLGRGFTYQYSWRDVVNVFNAQTNRRELGSLAVVWQHGGEIILGANETQKVSVATGDPFWGAVTPVQGTDYQLAFGTVGVSLSRASGCSTELTLVAGAGGAHITGLQLRALPLLVTSRLKLTNTVDTSASKATYGTREQALNIWPEMDPNVVRDLLNVCAKRYQEPRTMVTFSLNNGTSERLTQMLTRKISDRVTIVEAETATNGEFFIEHIAHDVQMGGRLHTTVFGCEKVPQTYAYATWGSGRWGQAVLAF